MIIQKALYYVMCLYLSILCGLDNFKEQRIYENRSIYVTAACKCYVYWLCNYM